MTFGEPNKSSGSPPERHPEHPKIPSAALKPLHARSFAPVDRNRSTPMTPCGLQPPSPPSPFYSYVKTLFLSPSPLASPRAGPSGSAECTLAGGWGWSRQKCTLAGGCGLGRGWAWYRDFTPCYSWECLQQHSPAQASPGQPAQPSPGQASPAQPRPAQPSPGQPSPGQHNPGHASPGQHQCGCDKL